MPWSWGRDGPAVGKLLLKPGAHKTFKVAAGNSTEVTATLFDANGNAVAGTVVRFSVKGSAHATVSPRNATTNDEGTATTTVTAAKHGVAVVVASATNTDGVHVLSKPTKIAFKTQRTEADK